MRALRHTARLQGASAPVVVADPRRVGELAARARGKLPLGPSVCAAAAADGRSPEGMYAALRAHAAAGSLLSDRATVLRLDEYAGLEPADQRSFGRATA
jgi:hypothetical protein